MPGFWRRAVLAVGALSLLACGQPEEDMPPEAQAAHNTPMSKSQTRKLHKGMDRDGDGKVSAAEVTQHFRVTQKDIVRVDSHSILQNYDHNKDGKVSLEEVLQDIDRPPMQEGFENDAAENEEMKKVETEKFKVADADGDGFLDSNEVVALFFPETHDGVFDIVARQRFKAKDDNADGSICLREWRGFYYSDSGEKEGEVEGSLESDAEFGKFDANADRTLDFTEFREFEKGPNPEHDFDELVRMADQDGDHHLTVEEMIAARHKIVGSEAYHRLMISVDHLEL